MALPAAAATGSDPFTAGQEYSGDFADPSVLRVGDVFYAYGTTTGGNNVPAMWSRDLHTWWARDAWPLSARFSRRPGFNDALPFGAPFAAWHWRHGRKLTGAWAPSVRRVQGRYVMAYVVRVRNSPERFCISVATSPRPLGPFLDRRHRPIVCSKDPRGSIDPQLFADRGRLYLLWKNAGVKGVRPTRIFERRLAASGTRFAHRSRPHLLLETQRAWEGNVVENPAMVRFHGRLYLFYSGNSWESRRYAVGYATCRSPHGPCVRPKRPGPLLASGGRVAGPGGGSPFADRSGRLRLAYAAWEAGRPVGYPRTAACRRTVRGCNQRRLHVASLRVGTHGRLRVTARG